MLNESVRENPLADSNPARHLLQHLEIVQSEILI